MIQSDLFTKQEIEQLRKKLNERKSILIESKKAIEDEARELSGELPQAPADFAELGSLEENRNLSLDIIEHLANDLREIVDAEDRLASGAYGICRVCKVKIPMSRLKAIPETPFCSTCKDVLEHSEKRFSKLGTVQKSC